MTVQRDKSSNQLRLQVTDKIAVRAASRRRPLRLRRTLRVIRYKYRDPLQRVLRSEFVRHGTLLFASTTLINTFNFIFHFFSTRLLGVESYGALASLINGLAIMSVPATVLTLIVVKYCAELHAVDDAGKIRQLSLRFITYTALVGCVLFTSVVLFSYSVAAYLHISSIQPVIFAAFILWMNLISPGARGILQGTQDFVSFALSSAIEVIGKAAIAYILIVAGFGLNGAVAGFAAASTLSAVYTIWAASRHWGKPGAVLRFDLRRLMETSGGIAGSTLALTILSFSDVLLVKHFFSGHQAGLYGAISLAGKILLFVAAFVPTLVLPKATAFVTQGKSPRPILLQAMGAMILLCAAVLTGYLFFSRFIVTLIAGSAYLSVAPYLLRYGFAMTMLGSATVVANYKIGLHRFSFIVALSVAAISEIVAIYVFHRTLNQVINILVIGHTFAFIGSLADTKLQFARRRRSKIVDQAG
ncbi:MAG: oligosaccharide flippase family protein [Candidatus Eremiobacteraeota bacterium]|nr:oligosaccharide flippase family protein [Candidatus Eremiobacteraeota bacterium]